MFDHFNRVDSQVVAMTSPHYSIPAEGCYYCIDGMT